jgi:hypothetical protein
VIESLRNSEPSFLAMFAVCTGGIALAIEGLGSLVYGAPTEAATNGAQAVSSEWHALQVNASITSSHLFVESLCFWALTFVVLAIAYIKGSRAAAGIRLFARIVYLLSILVVIVTVSSVVCLIMIRAW